MPATDSPPDALLHNIPKWLEDNKANFVPPVCNYMMHGAGRLKVMFVGGPNIRKDFHLEEGEEFFYMEKGDMVLRVLEEGKFVDIAIKEGEVFQLPGKIPHSPQRFENTMGLVIERERMKSENDSLRYYVGDTTDLLYEEWFYCADLGTQIGPVIKRYFASEAHKTGKPSPGSITSSPPFVPDPHRKLEKPFSLMKWVEKHAKEIESSGSKLLFDTSYQSDIIALGAGKEKGETVEGEEVWFWQLVGVSTITICGGEQRRLGPQDSFLVQAGTKYCHEREKGSVCLSVMMTWKNKDRAFKHLKGN